MRQGYRFRAVRLDDLTLLAAWRAAPHVAAWWDAARPLTEADLREPRVARRIVTLAGRPFAYMQDYTVHGWEEGHHFAALPEGTRGIDQFIGLAGMLGQGHGPAFVAQRLGRLFAAGAPVIATDPHPDNSRAIAACTRLGFRPAGPPRETRWGRILPMQLTAADWRRSRIGRAGATE